MNEKSKIMAVIAEDSDQQLSHFMDLTERMDDAIRGLQALETLFAGHGDKEISDLAHLTAPFIQNMKKINDELMDFFYKSDVVFAFPAKNDKAVTQAEVSVLHKTVKNQQA